MTSSYFVDGHICGAYSIDMNNDEMLELVGQIKTMYYKERYLNNYDIIHMVCEKYNLID